MSHTANSASQNQASIYTALLNSLTLCCSTDALDGKVIEQKQSLKTEQIILHPANAYINRVNGSRFIPRTGGDHLILF
ncbi:MAG: hypothetical protein NW220_14155 [Leptolyngbyaceae cyanobacterium bins.349]|nr:hypothetical protein [Leptolyngbyaceae cyanobacterium bins.349]